MRSRRLPGLPVLSIAAGTRLGRVRRPLVNPEHRRVVGLIVSGKRPGNKKVLPMDAVHALGSYAVTVDGADSLKKFDDACLGPLPELTAVKIVGSPVITVEGSLVGIVYDFEIRQDGSIHRLLLSKNVWKLFAHKEVPVPGREIVALGQDAIIVSNDVLAMLAELRRPTTKKRLEKKKERVATTPSTTPPPNVIAPLSRSKLE